MLKFSAPANPLFPGANGKGKGKGKGKWDRKFTSIEREQPEFVPEKAIGAAGVPAQVEMFQLVKDESVGVGEKRLEQVPLTSNQLSQLRRGIQVFVTEQRTIHELTKPGSPFSIDLYGRAARALVTLQPLYNVPVEVDEGKVRGPPGVEWAPHRVFKTQGLPRLADDMVHLDFLVTTCWSAAEGLKVRSIYPMANVGAFNLADNLDGVVCKCLRQRLPPRREFRKLSCAGKLDSLLRCKEPGCGLPLWANQFVEDCTAEELLELGDAKAAKMLDEVKIRAWDMLLAYKALVVGKVNDVLKNTRGAEGVVRPASFVAHLYLPCELVRMYSPGLVIERRTDIERTHFLVTKPEGVPDRKL